MTQLSIDDPPVCALDTLAACAQAAMAWCEGQPVPKTLRNRVARTGDRFLREMGQRGALWPTTASVASFHPYLDHAAGVRWQHITREQFEAALSALVQHLIKKMDQK